MKRDVNFGWAIFGIYVASWIIGLWLSSSFGASGKAILWPAVVFVIASAILLVGLKLRRSDEIKIVKVFLDLTKRLGAKDLTLRADIIKEGFLSQISDGLNKMVETILGIRIFASKIGIATEEVVEAAKFSSDTMQSVAAFASEIAKAADEISSLASETSMRVQTFSAGVQESSSTIENVATQGRFVESEAEEDVRLVKETTEGIVAVDEATKQVSEAIGQMQKVSRDIVEIVGSIKGIAAQTNLLALNAAIEAARAGEHGRGFAVVAEEVRNLAEESSRAASNIENLANNIKALAEDGVESINLASERVKEANVKAGVMSESIKKVLFIVRDLIKEIELTSETFQTQAESSVEMANLIVRITEKVEHQNERLDEINALLYDEATSSEVMAERMKLVLSSAQVMEKALFEFKLSAGELSSSLLKQRGILRIGVENVDLGRFHFWRDGKAQGLDIDLGREIANALGVRVEIVPIIWGNGEKGTLSGTWLSGDWSEFDTVISGITKLPARAENVTFSATYASIGLKVIFRKQDGFNSLKDLADKKVGAQKGSTNEAVAKARLTGATIVPYPGSHDLLVALKKGEICAAVIDSPTVQNYLDEDSSLSSLRTVLAWEHFGVVLPKFVSSELKELIDETILKNRDELANQWLNTIREKASLIPLR